MRLLLALLLIMVVGPAGAAYPSDADSDGFVALADDPARGSRTPGLGLDYFRSYVSDTWSILASPLSWRGSDWLRFAVVVGATYAISSEEEEVQVWMQSRRNDDTDMVAQYTRPLGSGRYVVPALCALYGYGHLSGSRRARRTALLGLKSVIISGFFTGALKYLTHKQRPSPAITDDIPWGGPGASQAHLSFPSGHSACGFAVATIVASEYGDHALIPALAYCAASLAALSRVNDNAHWPSDVILGSAIGHYTARAVLSRHGGGREGLRILPFAVVDGAGLMLSRSF